MAGVVPLQSPHPASDLGGPHTAKTVGREAPTCRAIARSGVPCAACRMTRQRRAILGVVVPARAWISHAEGEGAFMEIQREQPLGKKEDVKVERAVWK
jgi:hypothetical protein